MKLYVVFVICFFIVNSAANDEFRSKEAVKTSTDNESYIDILRKDLISHSWTEDEKPCLNQILKTIDNVKNTTLWATWIWDSIQLPVGQLYGSKNHFGNYDQCLSETVGDSFLPFRTQYCWADIVWRSAKEAEIYHDEIDPYTSVKEYIRSRTKLNLRFNVLTWGVCVPENCEKKSVKTFVTALFKQSHLAKLQISMDVTVKNCEPSGESKKHMDGNYYLTSAALFVVGLALISTVYMSKQKVNSSSYVRNILKCFCLKRNTKDFLDVNEKDIKVLHGIRFLSCSLIVFMHSLTIVLSVSAANGLDQEELFNSYGSYISELTIVVDTFFVLSGLLIIKNIKRKLTIRNVAEFIIKRYFRLIWWYIAAVLIVVFVLPRFGCGPQCDIYMQRERGACLKTWWLGFLMLANYIDLPQICYPTSWYVFCDFHLSVIGVLLLWIHQNHRRTAMVCFIVLTILSATLPSLAIYNATEVVNFGVDFAAFEKIRTSDAIPLLTLYMNTHNRAIPYVVGMMLGYIMSNCKEMSVRIVVTKTSYISLTVMVLGVFSYLFISLSDNCKGALILAAVRFGWALFVCALIALCEYGKLPSIEAFLSWSVFAPLSKLTYGIYSIHYVILAANLVSVRGRLHVNEYIWAEKFFGNLTMAGFISLFFLLFVEAPLNNLVKLFLSSKIFRDSNKAKLKAIDGDDVSENITKKLTLNATLINDKEKQL